MSVGTSPLFGTHRNDLVVANALVWAALIVAVTATVRGTGLASGLLPLMVAAALGSVGLVAFGVRQFHHDRDRDR